ncbi:Vacuolar protein sorting-associated protein 52, partial [Cryomyces antarcticus]
MWLDRFSGQSTPSTSPPPSHNRSYSPAPRRSSHLAPSPLPHRPAVNPRGSSLSLASNASSSSIPTATRLPNGSSLKHQVSSSPPENVADPLRVLESIIGAPRKKDLTTRNSTDGSVSLAKPVEVVEDIDFGGLSLQEFINTRAPALRQPCDLTGNIRSSEEHESEKDKFEDLHRSILACDEVLQSVEVYLTSFQTDLGAVSAEIETLQNRSTALNTRLENRKIVEKLLGPAVEETSISPAIVRKISEEPMDESWIKALDELEKKSKIVEGKSKQGDSVKAVEEVKPLLENLTNKAVERIRDYIVSQVKALRSPNVNAQIIQQQTFLQYKDVYAFLARHQPRLAEEIGQAYINTMRWYYLHNFTRYRASLETLRIHVIDKHDLIGLDDSARKSTLMS